MVEIWSLPRKNRIWLVSYPRSGNTWLRFFFERYTEKGTRSLTPPYTPLESPTDETFLWKRHELYEAELDETDKIIFLIRNPLNAIPSSIRWDGKQFTDEIVEKYINHYCNEINEYEKYPGEKIILYYEDLIKDFKKTIRPVLQFLNLEINEYKIDNIVEDNDNIFHKTLWWFEHVVPDKTSDNVYGDMKWEERKYSLSKQQQQMIKNKIKDIKYLERYNENSM